jgi:tRNA 2-thiouridine synthesizing protein D
VYRVFFYHDGVHNGTRLSVPPQDERDITRQWRELAQRFDIDLVVCIGAAQRRGVLDESEARRHGKHGDNLASEFRVSGLGQLIDAGIQTDRLVVFGD